MTITPQEPMDPLTRIRLEWYAYNLWRLREEMKNLGKAFANAARESVKR